MDAEEKDEIRFSVRSLVEFVFRSGDIDNRFGRWVPTEAMQEGSRLHRSVQGSRGAGYRSEMVLEHEVPMGNYVLRIEGRADGIFSEEVPFDGGKENLFFIDEIKSMYTDVTRFEKPVPVHLAQAKCYAYIFALQNGLERIGVQLSYFELGSDKTKMVKEVYSFGELKGWFDDMIESCRRWTDFEWEWKLIRGDSIKRTGFPFPYREGQRRLVGDVYRTILRKKILFLMAPTGTGKTIATVFPAVQAMGQGKADRVFYLTARTITRTVAREAFEVLKAGGLKMKVITLTAKDKICPLKEPDCNPASCPYAGGHYDRVNDAVYELLTAADDYTREALTAQAEKYRVCPYEMSLDLALFCDAIICDYNYVFNPRVYLRRFFGEGKHGDYVFLIDEAHNMLERGRDMYSADLVKEDFLKFKKIFKKYSKKISSGLEGCNRLMLGWKRECEGFLMIDSLGELATLLVKLVSDMDTFLRHRKSDFAERKEVTEYYFYLRHFLNMYDLKDENYVIYADFDREGRFVLHLRCVNPAKNLQNCLDKGRSAVFFSATLLPINYYKKLLSTKEDNYAVYAESSFDKEQRLLFVAGDVSSLYTRRNEEEYRRIAAYIGLTAAAKRGNYIVYFPSYKFLEDVYAEFAAADGGKTDCIFQTPDMTEEERKEFMEEFSESRERSLVAFCVVGGIFAEGIDLPAERLIGVLIVGTGLPQICNEREILKSFYGSEGFSYAYRYPGMIKVMQAAGRVIRTSSDVGVIGLLDERFLRREYREFFPREWDDFKSCTLERLLAMLDEFWKEKG